MPSYDPDLQPFLDDLAALKARVEALPDLTARVAALEARPEHSTTIADIVDVLGSLDARLDALEGVPPDEPREPVSARGWTAINIQMEPFDLIEADKVAGIDRAASYHRLAYLAHAEAPVRMSAPQPPMAEVIRILGPDLILRTPINKWQFDPDGALLEPEYQRMLDEWVAAGGRIQPVHAWLGQEDWPEPVKAEGDAAMLAYLDAVPDTVIEGWQRFGLWFERQPQAMQDAVVALEIFNEPAIYDKAIKRGLLTREEAAQRFADDQILIADAGMDWWPGQIMPTLFAYSSRTAEMLIPDADGQTGLDRIRDALGSRIIWSVHRYPDWVKGRTPDEWRDTLLAGLEPLSPDPIVITETNADLGAAPDSSGYQAARVLGDVAAEGIGIGWFSGINYASALISFWSRPPSIRNIDRVAAFWDAATINHRDPSRLDEPFKVNRSRLDRRGGADDRILRIVGAAGGDTIAPTEAAATLVYGNTGDDEIIINPNAATWVFGQHGNDIIVAQVGPFAILVMGDGDDLVELGADQVFAYGGRGVNTFVLATTGAAVIDNFLVGVDTIDSDGLDVKVAVDGADLVLTAGAGTCRLLGRGTADPAVVMPGYEPPVEPGTGLTNPSVGSNLEGVVYWTTEQPFVDVLKAAGVTESAGSVSYRTLAELPAAMTSAAGAYILRYRGKGSFRVNGGAAVTASGPGQTRINYQPNGGGAVVIDVTPSDAADPLTLESMVHEANLDAHAAGEIFSPRYIDRIKDLRVLRFMDWQRTNGSMEVNWAGRFTPASRSWEGWPGEDPGVPVEVMVALANKIGADPWFCMPHRATDDYVRRFAEVVKTQLDPRLCAHVEYTNEAWNGQFPQTAYVDDQGIARGLGTNRTVAGARFVAHRLAEIASIWGDVFGTDQRGKRYRTVLAVHPANTWLATQQLTDGGTNPTFGRQFDGYATTGYYGFSVGGGSGAQDVWNVYQAQGEAAAVSRAVDLLAADAAKLPEGANGWRAHKALADQHGLALMVYEGGAHANPTGSWQSNATFRDILAKAHRSAGMAPIYKRLLNDWRAAGGTVFCLFQAIGRWTEWGYWGHLEHVDAQSPRWDAVSAWNAANPAWWETRAPGTFLGRA